MVAGDSGGLTMRILFCVAGFCMLALSAHAADLRCTEADKPGKRMIADGHPESRIVVD